MDCLALPSGAARCCAFAPALSLARTRALRGVRATHHRRRGCVRLRRSPPKCTADAPTVSSGGRVGAVSLTAATMMWAISNTIQRKLIGGGLHPSIVAATRFGACGLLLLPQAHLAYLGVAFRLASLSFIANAAMSIALRYAATARVSVLTSLCVVLTPLVKAIIDRTPPARRDVLASAISASGVYLMAKPGFDRSNPSLMGDVLSLTSALFLALYTVALGAESPNYNTRQLTATLRVCNGLISVSWALLQLIRSRKLASAANMGIVTVSTPTLAVGLSALTVMLLLSGFLQVYGQKLVSPTQSALIFALVPLWSAIVAFSMLRETVNTTEILGGATLIGGCVVGQLSRAGEKKKSRKQ